MIRHKDEITAELRDAFLTECAEDYVGLWSLIWELKHEGPAQSSADLRASALALARDLLDAGMLAGQFDHDVFNVWRAPPAEVVKRIEQEWDALDREPSLGDIVWFTSPAMLNAA